jgi:hypothetical protein
MKYTVALPRPAIHRRAPAGPVDCSLRVGHPCDQPFAFRQSNVESNRVLVDSRNFSNFANRAIRFLQQAENVKHFLKRGCGTHVFGRVQLGLRRFATGGVVHAGGSGGALTWGGT